MEKPARQSKIPRVLLGLAGGLAVVEIAARLNVRREQARRRDLDGERRPHAPGDRAIRQNLALSSAS
jgi:hypothetical protein